MSRGAYSASGGEVVLLTDVTESHLMQVFLPRQQRLLTLGELAAGLAHQIRTPLATALLYASQMTLPGAQPRRSGALRRADRRQPEAARSSWSTTCWPSRTAAPRARWCSVSALLEQVAQWLRPGAAPRRAARPSAPRRRI